MNIGQVVAVIDIGSTKVSCCIANVFENNRFEILGVGCCVCVGVKAGIIVDMDSVCKSVARAVESAEKVANLRIKSVFVNVSGKYVKSKIISSSVNIGGRIIKEHDVENLVYQGINRDTEDEVIHSIPIMFEIDSMPYIDEPLGMFANVLKANVNVVTVPRVQLNNIVVCLSKCHLDVVGVVYSGYAAGLCVLDENLNQENHIVIDFGGGVTTVNFFYKGIFCGTEIIPLGGKNITKDVAYGINISQANAERLKTLHGAAFVSFDDRKSVVLVPVQEESDLINLQQIPRNELNQIIQPRIEEIFKMIRMKIDNSMFKSDFSRDFIITGGGSLLTGLREYLSEFFKKNVRLKKMDDFLENSGIQLNNDFSTTVGTIKFALLSNNAIANQKKESKEEKNESFFKKTMNWIENNL